MSEKFTNRAVEDNAIMPCQQNEVVQIDQIIVPQVETIGLTSALVEGFGGEGMIYGKTYELKVLDFVAGIKPDDKNSIRWGYSDKTKIDEEAIELEQTGETIKFKVDNYELLGKELTFFAYIGNRKCMVLLPKVKVHNRFRWFNEQTVKEQLADRVEKPQLIDQHHTSLCGVAAVAYLLAKDYPLLFVNKFMEFLRTGETLINKFEVKPNPSLYEMKPGDTKMKYPYSQRDGIMEEADWLVLAGIRSSDNHSYEGKEGEDFDAINWPSFMTKIVKDLYGADVVEDKTSLKGAMAGLFSAPHHQELRTIQQEFERGYDFIFMIDADMLSNTVSSVGCINQYHWIVYQGELKIDEEKKECGFKYYSWGRLMRGDVCAIPLSFDAFDSNFYGCIKCKKAVLIDSPVKIKSPDEVKSIKENESYA